MKAMNLRQYIKIKQGAMSFCEILTARLLKTSQIITCIESIKADILIIFLKK